MMMMMMIAKGKCSGKFFMVAFVMMMMMVLEGRGAIIIVLALMRDVNADGQHMVKIFSVTFVFVFCSRYMWSRARAVHRGNSHC